MERSRRILENCNAYLENADVPGTGYSLVLVTWCGRLVSQRHSV